MKKNRLEKLSSRDFFVGVVLFDNLDRVYLIKEEDKNRIGKNRWNFPGGSVDAGEGLLGAALRETREETGYNVRPESLVGCYLCRKENKLWIYVVFSGMVDGRVRKKVDLGVKKGKWFDKEKFLHLSSGELVHPDMQLVYNIAIEGRGLSLDSVKFIDYDVQ